jgi:serine/threonine protein kinase
MLNPDTLLHDRYRIVRSIGQGGMGAVYEAIDQRLRARVALKQTTVSGEQWSKAFEHEAQLLAGLRHRALPRVIDHFIEPDGQFLVMEYIPGEDLAGMLKQRSKPFDPPQVLDWADQILDALDYLHSHDPPVIHRDIKPQNLKLTPRNELVLLDFGLAKGSIPLATAAGESASLFGYTPQYAPIEQVQGTGTEARSDLYSLAATLYHLLTGQVPTDTLTRAAAVLDGKPDPLRSADQLNPGVSRPIAGAIAQGMGLRAGERFANATAMRRALQYAAADATTVPQAATEPTLVARQPIIENRSPTSSPRPETVSDSDPAPPPPESAPTAPAAQPRHAKTATTVVERRGCVLGGCVTPLLFVLVVFLMFIIGGAGFFIFGSGSQMLADMPIVDVATAFAESSAPVATIASIAAEATAPTPVPGMTFDATRDATTITLDARIQDEISNPGQHKTYAFTVDPNNAVFVWFFDYENGMNQIEAALIGPDGQEIVSRCLGCGNIGRIDLRQGGTYRLVVGNDRAAATGRYDIRINSVPEPKVYDVELDVRIAEAGFDPVAALIGKPGAQTVVRFAVEPNSAIFVWFFDYEDGMNQIEATLIGPDDQEIVSRCLGCGSIGRVALRQGGTYRLEIGSELYPATGAYDIRINTVPVPGEYRVTLPLTIGPDTVAEDADLIARPGATQIFDFDLPANSSIFIRTLAFDNGMNQIQIRLIGPEDQEVVSRCLGCGDIGRIDLRQGGTYRLVIGSELYPSTGRFALEVSTIE